MFGFFLGFLVSSCCFQYSWNLDFHDEALKVLKFLSKWDVWVALGYHFMWLHAVLFGWCQKSMHALHLWWQLPAPRSRRRLWGPSRISNGSMEQLGRTDSEKINRLIKPRSKFKRIVSAIDIFLFATDHLDTKPFYWYCFLADPTLQKTLQRSIATQTANLRRCDTLPSIGFLGFSMENQAKNEKCGECFGGEFGGSLCKLESGRRFSEKFRYFSFGVCLCEHSCSLCAAKHIGIIHHPQKSICMVYLVFTYVRLPIKNQPHAKYR